MTDPSPFPELPAEHDVDVDLADAVRRVVRLSRTSAVGSPARETAMAHLAATAAVLEVDQHPGPYWQTGLAALEQFAVTGALDGVFPFSPATGQANPIAPKVDLSVDDDKTVHGMVTFTEPYNGPPFDTCHGGIIALVYDDLIGMAAMVGAGGGMTARLTINYRKPTPLFRPIEITAWLESQDGRKFIARGEMRCEGELVSEADGLFIRPQGLPPGTATG